RIGGLHRRIGRRELLAHGIAAHQGSIHNDSGNISLIKTRRSVPTSSDEFTGGCHPSGTRAIAGAAALDIAFAIARVIRVDVVLEVAQIVIGVLISEYDTKPALSVIA